MAFKFEDNTLAFDSDGFIFAFLDSDGRSDDDSAGINGYEPRYNDPNGLRSMYAPNGENEYYGTGVAIDNGKIFVSHTKIGDKNIQDNDYNWGGVVHIYHSKNGVDTQNDSIGTNDELYNNPTVLQRGSYSTGSGYTSDKNNRFGWEGSIAAHKGHVIVSYNTGTNVSTQDSYPGGIAVFQNRTYGGNNIDYQLAEGWATFSTPRVAYETENKRIYEDSSDNFGVRLAASNGRIVVWSDEVVDSGYSQFYYGGFYVYQLMRNHNQPEGDNTANWSRAQKRDVQGAAVPAGGVSGDYEGMYIVRDRQLTGSGYNLRNPYGAGGSAFPKALDAGYGIFAHIEYDRSSESNGQITLYRVKAYLSIYCIFTAELLGRTRFIDEASVNGPNTAFRVKIKYNKIVVSNAHDIWVFDLSGYLLTRHRLNTQQTGFPQISALELGGNMIFVQQADSYESPNFFYSIRGYDILTGEEKFKTGNQGKSKDFLHAHRNSVKSMSADGGRLVMGTPNADSDVQTAQGPLNMGKVEVLKYNETYADYVEKVGESYATIPGVGRRIELR